MSSETKEKSHIERLLEQTMDHVETRLEYFTLVSTEKVSDFASNMARILAAALFGGMMFFFFSMGFAYWLGDKLGSRGGGFAVTGLIFLPALIASWRLIKPLVRAKIIESVLDQQDNGTNKERP